MTHLDLIITSGGFAAVVVVALTLRRRRERLQRLALAAHRAWELPTQSNQQLLTRIKDVALTQIGHGRRITASYRTKGRTTVFSYEFETGLEQRRRLHPWLVVVQEVNHGCSRATITRHEWVAATVRCSAYHTIRGTPSASITAGNAENTAIVEDADEWKPTLAGPVGQWLADQPRDRTWEVLPGLIVGYQPGMLQVDELEAMTVATGALARQLRE